MAAYEMKRVHLDNSYFFLGVGGSPGRGKEDQDSRASQPLDVRGERGGRVKVGGGK